MKGFVVSTEFFLFDHFKDKHLTVINEKDKKPYFLSVFQKKCSMYLKKQK